MRQVKIEKDRLRSVVRANRSKHREELDLATRGYQIDLIQALESNLASAKGNARHRVQEIPVIPDDHTQDYDRVLSMIEYSADDEIILDQAEYRQFVEDDWSWKASWSGAKYRSL